MWTSISTINIRKHLIKILLFIFSVLVIASIILIFTLTYHETSNDFIVKLPIGKIKGRKDISMKRNVSFYSFLQIPFAQPPIGKLRFMAPKPVEKWDGILNCTENTKICYQLDHDEEYETEDCLHLNVYTPVEPGSNSALPVMFYIYGGGFREGSATFNNQGPHFFMEEEVIIVTTNYRLDAFGFISTNDAVIPGNNGLKDQNLALKWVQENIRYFGGDPNKVTIFGQSAGAAAVGYQLLSKQSAGLFRAAILQSGSALLIGAYQRNARYLAYNLAINIDPNFNLYSTSEELLRFLQSVNSSALIKASRKLKSYGLRFAPVVEVDVEHAFITELMYESIEEGNFNKVPSILGICSEEELTLMRYGINRFKQIIAPYDKYSSFLVNADFHIKNISEKRLVGKLIKEMYTEGRFSDDLGGGIKYLSDNRFTRAIIKHATLQSNFTDVYFYQFSYHGKLGQNHLPIIEGAEKVAHAEDLHYLWCSNNISNIADYYPQSDVRTLERYVRLLTNFAKYLNPTPQPENLLQNITWPKFVENNLQYLNINNTLEIKENPKGDVYNKWVSLYEKYGVKPFDTY